jgi:hypothetical protein
LSIGLLSSTKFNTSISMGQSQHGY